MWNRSLSVGLGCLLLVGCASVPMAPADLDAKAKQFTTVSNKSNLYIYRNEHFGRAIPMTVSINGKVLGQTAAQTYFWLQLAPGQYNLDSHTENVSNLSLTAEPGKDYFVWQEVKMGLWAARSQLQQVDEKTGRDGVLESKLIHQNLTSVEPLSTSSSPISQSEAQVSLAGTAQQKLRELQGLRKEGLISESEYQKKKQQLLNTY